MPANDRWRRTFEDEQARLWQALWAFGGDREIAAEAVAEAFAQGVRRADAVVDPAAWVWKAAFRICSGLLAARAGRLAEDDGVLRSMASDAMRPDEVVVLLDALDRLGEADRRLVALGLVGGLDSSSLGEALGISAGAARVRLHRARGRLRRLLEGSGPAVGSTAEQPPVGGA